MHAGLVLKSLIAVGGPVVHRFENEWVMWFHGRTGEESVELPALTSGRISMATSPDGLEWTQIGVALEASEDWWAFDSAHVGLGDVVPFANGEWRGPLAMYYWGGPNAATELRSLGIDRDGSVPAMDLRVGLAGSQDGRKWARIEGDEATGEILGPDDGEAYLGWPNVLFVDGTRVLWYQALDRETKQHVIGRAVSSDGVRFRKEGPVFRGAGTFDAKGVSRRCVRQDGDRLKMWYEGLGEAGHAIGLATSDDKGCTWTTLEDPVFTPSGDEGAWDAGVVSAPYVLTTPEGLRMYYVGASKAQPKSMAIGAADSADGGLTWTRVRTPYAQVSK